MVFHCSHSIQLCVPHPLYGIVQGKFQTNFQRSCVGVGKNQEILMRRLIGLSSYSDIWSTFLWTRPPPQSVAEVDVHSDSSHLMTRMLQTSNARLMKSKRKPGPVSSHIRDSISPGRVWQGLTAKPRSHMSCQLEFRWTGRKPVIRHCISQEEAIGIPKCPATFWGCTFFCSVQEDVVI